MKKQKVLIVRGLQGSGKTTLSQSLVDSKAYDTLIELLPKESMNDFFLRFKGSCMLNKNVIVANTFTDQKKLQEFIDYCTSNKIHVDCVVVENRTDHYDDDMNFTKALMLHYSSVNYPIKLYPYAFCFPRSRARLPNDYATEEHKKLLSNEIFKDARQTAIEAVEINNRRATNVRRERNRITQNEDDGLNLANPFI